MAAWKGDGDDKIEGFPEGVLLRNTEDNTGHGCQATIDMKFSLDNIKALYEDKKSSAPSEFKLLNSAISIFEKCVVPTAKASSKDNKHSWETFTVPQKYPLFFKIFQGLMVSTENTNTVKSNENILFKFSYAMKDNFIDHASSATEASSGRAYDLVEQYSQKAKFGDANTYVKDCVNGEVRKISGANTPWTGGSVKQLSHETFATFWETPTRANDPFQNPELPGTGVIHNQVKPKINADHIITQVAFEIRNPNVISTSPDSGWPKAKAGRKLKKVAEDIYSWCSVVWPEDGDGEDGDQLVLAPLDTTNEN